MLDQLLGEHAQLAGPVDRVGEARGVDDLLRHLADPLVAVHRGDPQHAKGFVFRNLAGAHQHALRAIDQLALVEALLQLEQLAAQALLLAESGPSPDEPAAAAGSPRRH